VKLGRRLVEEGFLKGWRPRVRREPRKPTMPRPASASILDHFARTHRFSSPRGDVSLDQLCGHRHLRGELLCHGLLERDRPSDRRTRSRLLPGGEGELADAAPGDRGVLPRSPGGRLRADQSLAARHAGARPRGSAVLQHLSGSSRRPAHRERWAELQASGVAINNTQRDGQDCVEVRYYILSKYVSAQRFAEGCGVIGVLRTACTGNST